MPLVAIQYLVNPKNCLFCFVTFFFHLNGENLNPMSWAPLFFTPLTKIIMKSYKEIARYEHWMQIRKINSEIDLINGSKLINEAFQQDYVIYAAERCQYCVIKISNVSIPFVLCNSPKAYFPNWKLSRRIYRIRVLRR